MKKITLFLGTFLFLALISFAQAPNAINFQAIARGTAGEVLANTPIQIRLTIIDSTVDGDEIYQELRALTTNNYGSFSFQIGRDADYTTIGSMDAIDWGGSAKFLKIDYDPTNQFNWDLSLGTIEFVTVPYAFHAVTADTAKTVIGIENLAPKSELYTLWGVVSSNRYGAGSFYKGGVIFWVDESGEHGLVCAIEDQSPGIQWYAGANDLTRAFGNHIYAGQMNTDMILGIDSMARYHNSTAAAICKGYSYGGYSEWYLPSLVEAYLMLSNIDIINNTISINEGTPINPTGVYWTSTEISQDSAYMISKDVWEIIASKKDLGTVRAIRRF